MFGVGFDVDVELFQVFEVIEWQVGQFVVLVVVFFCCGFCCQFVFVFDLVLEVVVVVVVWIEQFVEREWVVVVVVVDFQVIVEVFVEIGVLEVQQVFWNWFGQVFGKMLDVFGGYWWLGVVYYVVVEYGQVMGQQELVFGGGEFYFLWFC